jgi:hypothetical protein
MRGIREIAFDICERVVEAQTGDVGGGVFPGGYAAAGDGRGYEAMKHRPERKLENWRQKPVTRS